MARGKPSDVSLRALFAEVGSSFGRLVGRCLWFQVLIGMFLGIAVGMALSAEIDLVPRSRAQQIAGWLGLPGNLFLAALEFVVVPLIAASVVRGIAAGGSVAHLRRVGLRVVAYFLMTTSIAVTIGWSIAQFFEPGGYVDSSALKSVAVPTPQPEVPVVEKKPTIPQAIVNLIPDNPYETLVAGDMLQVVIAATIFGIAIITLARKHARPLLDLLNSTQTACMVIVSWVMKFAPIAVFGLLAQITARVGLDAIVGVAAYVGIVITGLVAMLTMYLVLVAAAAGRSPVHFLRHVSEVMLMAFSMSSSAAVMPLTLKTAEEKLKVTPAVARFVVPLGATVNMDGTALYQAVAAIFLAQVFGIEIGLQGIGVILVTAIGASIGTPGTPGVGVVVLATILISVGIPEAGIALILGVDRIVDMCRTVVNVTGDLTACLLIDRLLGEDGSTVGGAAKSRPRRSLQAKRLKD